jgi:DNA-directed RNA polymerase alpha subunit
MRKCKGDGDFDYSPLSAEFDRLSRPAKRALLTAGIRTPAQLARKTQEAVLAFHGMGPGSLPVLKKTLKSRGLAFKSPSKR